MENCDLKQQVRLLTAKNDFEIESICDLNYFDITSDYNNFHNHDFYEYLLVVEGHGLHLINDEKLPLSRNTFVALKPSDLHCFLVPIGEKMRVLNLAFCKEIALSAFIHYEPHAKISAINSKFQESSLPQYPMHIKISDSQSNEIIAHYNSLNIKNSIKTPSLLLLKALFSYLHSIAALYSMSERDKENSLPDWLTKSLVGLSENDNCTLGIKYLMTSTGMDQSYLCRSFRRYLNCTPTEYVNSIRLKKSCTLLTYTSKSIMDICFECGFSSISHFNHLFKKFYNISPINYRKRA